MFEARLLVKRGMPPMRDSELVHKILDRSVPYVQINASGDVVIENE